MLDTIVALATAPIKSALGVIRLSGPNAFSCLQNVFNSSTPFYRERNIWHGFIHDDENLIDEVVVLTYVSPKSFTGEDVVEIMCHGSLLIANEIISLLIKYGARMATRGEFSSRAFMNGKIDLIQAEAINDMINATTSEAKKLSLFSLQGETSAKIKPLKKSIADLLALIDVNIDYPEYTDIEEAGKDKIVTDTETMLAITNDLIEEGRQGKIIREGIKVAIIGKPNVGKSSLLNALLREDKAIVTDIAGTTRDIVEGEINLHGIALHLFDTAGIHDARDLVENLGIDKAKKLIDEVDLVLVLLDASKNVDDEDKKLLLLAQDKKHLIIYNKGDLVKNKDGDKLYISALQKDTSSLEKAILNLFAIDETSYARPSLNNARQLGLLRKVALDLKQAQGDAQNGLPLDIVAVSLQNAYQAVCEILGENIQPDFTDEIFARFCLGK